jgi:hypothetical protein
VKTSTLHKVTLAARIALPGHPDPMDDLKHLLRWGRSPDGFLDFLHFMLQVTDVSEDDVRALDRSLERGGSEVVGSIPTSGSVLVCPMSSRYPRRFLGGRSYLYYPELLAVPNAHTHSGRDAPAKAPLFRRRSGRHDHDRTGSVVDQLGGDRTCQQVTEATVASGADHDQVGRTAESDELLYRVAGADQ